jgi:hypothetical protein
MAEGAKSGAKKVQKPDAGARSIAPRIGAHRAPLQTEGRVVAPVYDRRGRRGSAALPNQLKGRALLPRRPDLPSTSHGKNRAPQEALREGSGGRKGRE